MSTRGVLKENLRRELDRRGGDVAEVARLAGVPTVELYAALAGEHAAGVDWLERVAGALGIEVHELVRPR